MFSQVLFLKRRFVLCPFTVCFADGFLCTKQREKKCDNLLIINWLTILLHLDADYM